MPHKTKTRYEMIANQMMKGCSGKVLQGNIAGTTSQIEQFREIYHDTIVYIEEMIPKPISVGVCGALGKAVLWYGKDRMQSFVEAVGKRNFNGPLDPCHVLWEWMIRNSGRNTNEIYRRTVTAIRLFLRNAQNPILKPAKDDIFEWANNFRVMKQVKRNQWGECAKSKLKQTPAAFQADLDDVAGSPS